MGKIFILSSKSCFSSSASFRSFSNSRSSLISYDSITTASIRFRRKKLMRKTRETQKRRGMRGVELHASRLYITWVHPSKVPIWYTAIAA